LASPKGAGVLRGDQSRDVEETEGNERLTAVTGVILILMLAAVGVTILNLSGLLWEHLFIGLLVIGPVALKLGTTGYRFLRYYTGDRPYVRKGPPPILLRALGPLVVLTTVIVLASGIALLIGGPSSRNTFYPIHKISFIVWLVFIGVHILGHLPSLPKAMKGDYATRAGMPGYLPGRGARVLTLAGAIAAGLVLAIVLIPDFAAWTHSSVLLHHHHHDG
jgi:hypothetical protein